MINKIDGRKLLGNTALIDGLLFEGIGYCQSSISKIASNDEPFIVFNVRGTNGNKINCYMYSVDERAGYNQQKLTHRYVKIKGTVGEYAGRTTIILSEIELADDLTDEERSQFNREVSKEVIDTSIEEIERVLSSIQDTFKIQDSMKYLSLDCIDNGKVGSPLVLLYKVIKSCEIMSIDEDNNFRIPLLFTSYYTYIKYLKYLKMVEEGNNFTPVEVNKLIMSVNTGISLLDDYTVECLEELIKGNRCCSFIPTLICNEIRKYMDYFVYKEEWSKLLEGGEIRIKDRIFRKYKIR